VTACEELTAGPALIVLQALARPDGESKNTATRATSMMLLDATIRWIGHKWSMTSCFEVVASRFAEALHRFDNQRAVNCCAN
jgi:hypothetical protein